MTRRQRLHLRNQKVRKLFEEVSIKHPQWRIDAVITEVAERVFLSERTVEAILRGEGCYSE
ncbi:hypothetical protein JSO54_09695 [Riemerella anatipestifer]|uniref:hypothetical protein n=1 Tax=Riemerella anatipestifer TaxID=34085 RepID=UPI001374AEC6|nr:hypothetical protein [Riemerella anatipestifer]MDY3521980.1 hypothetical protein [Riemerella anatipestifer]MDY3534239.1 hypothetical protein [Riemerella anatipestifer]MDY3536297.1 hypothetical protein [Riemerella anatipestifer]